MRIINGTGKRKNIGYFTRVFLGFFALLLMIALILILAGRINYWQGWAFGGITVLLLLVKSIFFPGRSDLIEERIKKTLPGLGNFYMAGQWATPGGGVISSLYSGRHVVQILCHGEGKRFSVVLPGD